MWLIRGLAFGVQVVRESGRVAVVDDYVMLHHGRDCAHALWSAIDAANGTVVRRDAASTLVWAADVVHVVDRTARVGCVAAHEWFPLRVRLPRVSCADPYMRYQSYLADEGVVRAWGRSAAPIATRIIIVDDGVRAHSEIDVRARFLSAAHDRNGYHGTSVAGVAAARADGEGICGVAAGAGVVDVNLLSDLFLSDVKEAAAFDDEHAAWQAVYCNAWGPTDDGRCEQPGRLVRAAWERGVSTGRGGRGAIYVFAAGNGGWSENTNADGYANSPETIAVAAIDSRTDATPRFSEWGACVTVAARGSRVLGTSVGNSYTYRYGTSFSAPIVAGTIALMLDANPELGWRDVQEILMSSARNVDGALNAAGRAYSHRSGAGALRADLAVQLARGWRQLGPRRRLASRVDALPDVSTGVIVSVHSFAERLRVEHAQVCLTARTRGEALDVRLRSPSGSIGELNRATDRVSRSGCAFTDWCFTSLAHWGEASDGVWTVDVSAAPVGVEPLLVDYVEVRLFGADARHGFHGCL